MIASRTEFKMLRDSRWYLVVNGRFQRNYNSFSEAFERYLALKRNT